MSIKNSKYFTIKGKPTFNNVRGNQINKTFNVCTHRNGEIVTRRTEYDEFEYVKRGHVITLKEVCSMDVTETVWKNGKYHFRDRETRTKVYSIELFGQQSRFTAVEYEGKEADEVWEEDFRRFSRDRNPNSCLLYALNRSEVPLLIFHHELIPIAHLHTKSLWMDFYVKQLAEQIPCSLRDLWMDTSKGTFRVGLSGPVLHDYFPILPDNVITVPSTINMLNAATAFSFFRQFNSKELHDDLVSLASWFTKAHDCYHLLHPTFSLERSEEEQPGQSSFFLNLPFEQLRNLLPELRFDTVYSTSLEAVARWPQGAMQWSRMWPNALVDQTSIGELTRFTLWGDTIHVSAKFDDFSRRRSWLSQFPRFMEDEKAEDYFFIETGRLCLESKCPREYDDPVCLFEDCDGKNVPPIYLFLYPLTPTTISEVISWAKGRTHFWSLDENGQSEMTEEELAQWGIPRLTPRISSPSLVSWPSSIYSTLYDWQIACGFDPTTADFARYLELPELEVLRPKEERSSSWWEAIPGSGISAFGF